MRPEIKVGDRIRYRTDGEIGELNAVEIPKPSLQDYHYVTEVLGGIVYHNNGKYFRHHNRFDICNDFSNIGVGDEVELSNGRIDRVKYVDSDKFETDGNFCFIKQTGIFVYYGWDMFVKKYHYALRITKKAEPKPDKTHHAINGYNRYDYIPVDGIKMPKPQPQYKVGDWVECNGNQRLIEIIGRDLGHGNYYHFAHGFGGAYANSITRKLSPSEIIVKIGCLSGKVEDLSYAEDGRFWLIGKVTERFPVGMYVILYDEMLNTETREIVESLINAQKEEG